MLEEKRLVSALPERRQGRKTAEILLMHATTNMCSKPDGLPCDRVYNSGFVDQIVVRSRQLFVLQSLLHFDFGPEESRRSIDLALTVSFANQVVWKLRSPVFTMDMLVKGVRLVELVDGKT